VPEDWHAADPTLLINRAFAAPRVGPFQLDDDQIVDLLSDAASATAVFGRTAADLTGGAFHA
jgi:hypothetical protein